MNITLSAPDATVLAVRSWADANHTSLNQFIKADEFSRLIQTVHIRVPEGWKFDREEANARR